MHVPLSELQRLARFYMFLFEIATPQPLFPWIRSRSSLLCVRDHITIGRPLPDRVVSGEKLLEG